MNYAQVMADNLTARYDTMREIRDAKARLEELYNQWSDLAEEAQTQEPGLWWDFCYDGHDKPTPTWQKVINKWETNNPGWKVVNNGLRKIPQPEN